MIEEDKEPNVFIKDIDTCYTWFCRGKYKPNINQWYFEGTVSNSDVPAIDGYNIWLCFFCEYTGIETLVYYPKTYKKGELVKIIFKGENIDSCISWLHGEKGLYKEIIHPLLLLDKIQN